MSQLEFVWDRDKFDKSGDKDPGVKFGVFKNVRLNLGYIVRNHKPPMEIA